MGLVSYLCGLQPNSFQNTKWHSYDGYSIYMPSFNSLPQVVYPVGVTDFGPNFMWDFMWIILHNSVNPYWILAKISTKMHYFNEPFVCAKFQLDWCMHSWFMSENAKCVKWRWWSLQWRRNWNETLLACILGLAEVICFKFGMKIHLLWGYLCSIFFFNSDETFWSYISVKITFF